MSVVWELSAGLLAAGLAVTGGVTLYLTLLTVAAAANPARRAIRGVFVGAREPASRFVVLIPAHNEALVLGDVLCRLREQNYPASHFEVVVIADNCSDRTAAIAADHGVQVLERTDVSQRGKGQALDWAMKNYLRSWPRPFDAVVIMDADSVLNPDFLWFMDAELRAGHELLQAYYGVLNPLDNWRTSLATAAFAAFHFLRPLGRARLGLSCGLKGNGMAFSRRLVETYGYPAFSLVEDVELALFYLDRGLPVRFVPGAQVRGQMTTSTREAGTQRARWEGGRLSLVRHWVPRLLRRALSARAPLFFDGALDLLIPPLALLVLLAGAGLALALTAALVTGQTLFRWLALGWGAVGLALAAYVLAGLILARVPPLVYARLLLAPAFLAWKILAYAQWLCSRRQHGKPEWIRTGRQGLGDAPGDRHDS